MANGWVIFFYLSGNLSDRYINPPQSKEFHDFGADLRSFCQFDYRFSSRDSVRLLLINSGADFEIPNTVEEAEQGRDLNQESREQTAILTWEHGGDNSMLVTSLSERLASNRLLPTSDAFSINAGGLRNNFTFSGRSDYLRIIGSRNTIKTGVEFSYYRLREDLNFDPRDNEIEIEPFNFRGRRSGGEIGLYFQDKLQLTRQLSANLGLRFDHYQVVAAENAISPRINISYTLPKYGSVIHFAYNRLFAPPPNENLLLSTELAGNPPRASRSNLYEVGIGQPINRYLQISLTAFYRRDGNSFELTELANVRQFLPTAFRSGLAKGIEFSAQLAELPRLGLSGYFNYAVQRAEQVGPVVGGFADDELAPGQHIPAAFDQIHSGTAGLLWHEHRSGFWLSFSAEYGSGTPSEGIRLPGHFIANLAAGIDLRRKEKHKISLQFNVENLTNRVYAIAKESEFTPLQFSSPRYFSTGLRFSF